MATDLNVNGQDRKLDADPEMPLLWALRDVLNLTGTKYGCGIAQCGACIVLLDGQPVPSCVTTVAQAEGRRVTTIEGLHPEHKHPLQQAWIAEQVPQCGYCQPGMIMAAAAFLKDNPSPSDEEVKTGITNLCRCGTYPRIRAAIKRASAGA